MNEKFKKELIVTITIDNEFQILITRILEMLNNNSTDHIVRYDNWENVEMIIYLPIDSKVERNRFKTVIEYTSRNSKETAKILIDNKSSSKYSKKKLSR